MIRSEISQSTVPLPSKNFDKKPDAQDDFNLLLQMFTQPVVESGFDAEPEQQEVETKSLPLVETAEIFSRVFALQADESVAAPVDITHQLQPIKEIVITLPELADRKITILNGSLPVTVSIGEAKKMTAATQLSILTLNDEAGGEQQVVEWGLLATGYLSYLTPAVVSGRSQPFVFMVQPSNGQLRAGMSDFTQASWNRSLPAWTTIFQSDNLHATENPYAESAQVFETFDLEHSAATERMASAWYASEVSREYLNVLNDERGGFRLYYRNYFESDQKQAATLLFDLMNSDVYNNLTDAKINGQTVQRGVQHGR